MIRRFLLASVWLLVASSVSAQPSISSITGTTTLTITGSGFGSHPDYGGSQTFLNAGWNDFESALAAGNFRIDPDYASNNGVNLSTSSPRGGADAQFYRKTLSTVGGSPRLGSVQLAISGSNTRFYSAFHYRTTGGADIPSKFFRHYFGAAPNDFYLVPYNTDGNFKSDTEGFGGNAIWGTAATNLFNTNTWYFVEVLECLTGCTSQFGSSDYFEVRANGQRVVRRGTGLASNHIAIEGSASNENQQWVGGASGDSDGHTIDLADLMDQAGQTMDMGDALIDFGFHRVMACNTSTFSAAPRQCEMQIPLTWSATSITVTANRGATFGSLTDSNAYIYVCDSNNSCNAVGVQLGGGAGPAPPMRLRLLHAWLQPNGLPVFALVAFGGARFLWRKRV